MNITVFTYDFPHKKTQDFMSALILNGIKIDSVIAAPRVVLQGKNSLRRIKVKDSSYISAREICLQFNIPYFVAPHDSVDCENILRSRKIDLAIVAGARIIKPHIIAATRIGILNLHPGMIPYVRGLDAVKWAVYKMQPIGVTAHLIDSHIDAGSILLQDTIVLEPDDTFFDISQKQMNLEIILMIQALKNLAQGNFNHITCNSVGSYNRVMPADLEATLDDKLQEYKQLFLK